jgi:hypothetical protein
VVANRLKLPRNGAVGFIDWLGLIWILGFQRGGTDMRDNRLLAKAEVNVLFEDDAARVQQPVNNVPLNVIRPQLGCVIKEGCGRRSSRVTGADTENVHISYVSIEMIDNCQELRVRRPPRVKPPIVFPQEGSLVT